LRIVAFSDVHVDINSRFKTPKKEGNFLQVLVEVLQASQPDILICAGDIAPDSRVLEKTLKTIVKEVNAKQNLFIPGNHDIWFGPQVDPSSDATSSKDKYERVLPYISKKTGFKFLPDHPLVINGFGFLGTVGWYDYSFRNPIWESQFKILNYPGKKWGHSLWNDVRYAKWTMSDLEVCEYLLKKLDNDYQSLLKEKPREYFLVMHHVPFIEFVVYKNQFPWDFFSAFMGSKQFGKWAMNRISTVIFGHTHFPKNDNIASISTYCNPIGYLQVFKKSMTSLKDFLESRLIIIERNVEKSE
jgi:putative phosphoesterase